MPNPDQLTYVLTLGWNLLKPGESKGGIKDGYVLATVTGKYTQFRNIIDLLNDTYSYYLGQKLAGNPIYKLVSKNDIYDDVVRKTFQIQRHWFYYKVPKWLNVMNSLQQHVIEKYGKKYGLKAGNYTYLANLIESEFAPKSLSIFVEYGVPYSAILKLSKFIPDDLEEEEVLNMIRTQKLLDKAALNPYEKAKMQENL